MEHSAELLEYYYHPPPIKVDYESLSGRRLGVFHTADYFTIRTDGAGWTECKTEEELGRLAEKNPNLQWILGSSAPSFDSSICSSSSA